ncbi:cyclic nucleotide-binding domain-containing protein [Actinomadura sp. BRA 177]|uniref:cyclic nucleotide-binding domain-containing protein n=1 Tax=Actinomadura sp. BRA 177 TaxID=2745202 RepID=UPI001595F7D8|nr:cyclic nucleotide-binding domain-containing protein [Actinomadura sp. BRA 177]NVI88871.1 cyclic nucleotide-binding domain-containing protein [Actinomadura sp. BRA 177]
MGEHDRRHDPDQIVLPETHAVAPPPPRGEAAHKGLENTVVQPDGPSKRPGFWLSLTTIERAEFLATAQEVVYPAGAVLWEEGQAADHTIVIKSGTVRVCVERDGRERIIAFRGPGDIIGERAALMLRQRSATIVAMEPLHALSLTTQQFVTYLSNHPRVVAVLEREMYNRLTEQSGSMDDPQNGEVGHAYSYGPPVQYVTHQAYATAYIPIPPLWPHSPYAPTPAPPATQHTPPTPYGASPAGHRTGPHGATGRQRPSTRRHASNRHGTTGPRPIAGPHTDGWGYVAETYDTSWEPQTGPAATVHVPRQGHMAIASSAPKGASWAGRNCTIVYTDIAGFSSRVRDEDDRIEVRRAMYTALRESFEESGVPWDACYSEDRGDGALIVVPPEMPTAAVIDPMIAALGLRLRRHNHRSSEAVRIQLRVAMDVGPVVPDPPGMSGWTIINAARLLDAAPLKARLAATGADLGVIASRFVYDSVIAHSPGYVNADEYEPIACRVKETDIEGWIHLRGLPARSAIGPL